MKNYQVFALSNGKISKRVFYKGEGPGIIIMHELPGMVPECVEFADRLVEAGFKVYLPLLFGEAGEGDPISGTLDNFPKLCISKEFNLFANNETSPIVEWLKLLCRKAHNYSKHRGVGAIGMCLTGGFAIPLLVEPSLMAPVLSQPSLPINPILFKGSPGCSKRDYEFACARIKREKIPVLGFKFSHDIISPNEKFKKLQKDLGSLFKGTIIDSGPFNPHNNPILAHSVFTLNYQDRDGHPTKEALNTLIAYFKERLLGTSSSNPS